MKVNHVATDGHVALNVAREKEKERIVRGQKYDRIAEPLTMGNVSAADSF